MKHGKLLSALTAGLMVLSAGCSRPSADDPANANMLTIKGSDTMVHLVNAWAEAYMEAHPDSNIAVTGGGSGTGIAALLNGTTDLCMASRDIKPEELEAAKEVGVELTEHSVALDGIAVVVNPENGLSELSLEQIGKIFTGEYTNWQQAGGEDRPIVVLSRESSSGTYVFFREHAMGDLDYSVDTRYLPATATIVQQVGEDKGAIGYVGLGYAESAKDKVKSLGVIKAEGAEAVMPTMETVKDESYSIARALYLYQPGGAPEIADEFIAFCFSDEGQDIVEETGYVRVK